MISATAVADRRRGRRQRADLARRARAASSSRAALKPHASAPGARRSPPPSACGRPGWRSAAPCRPRSSSRITRLFSRSVVPVAVRSTIASTRPVSGASSTEPLTSTISTWRPVRSKCAAATRGYFVATRITPRRRSASAAGSGPATVATTIVQRPKPRSRSS